MPYSQLSLPVLLRDEATMDNYLPGPGNEAAVAALAGMLDGSGESTVMLHGPSGSGKSHLLQACCHRLQDEALYLPLGELKGYPADQVLENVQGRRLLCVDDLQAIAGDPDWERALFNCFNRARVSGQAMLFAADAPPRQLPIALADLRSRLSWAVVFQLPGVDDARRVAILQFRAQRRGLQLPEEVAVYLVSRAPRAMGALLHCLDRLDRASLARQRHLSIPFVKETLDL